jgi:NAD+ kinase
MAKGPRRIGFVIKHHHNEAHAFAIQLAKFVLTQKVRVYFATESKKTAQKLKSKVKIIPKHKLVDNTDLIIVLGGDGTFISIARLMKTKSIPIMGINMGQLGFLTEIKKTEAMDTLKSLLKGRSLPISKRGLLEVKVLRKKKVVFQGPVVNDAVISKGAIARIIGLGVAVNGKWSHDFRADGMIVSTPTGSTAYSLAAGGPIIEPTLSAMILTPICPHSLTIRPLVISDKSTVQICLEQKPGHVYLTLDGQDAVDLKQGDVVSIAQFKKHTIKLIYSQKRDYFGLLREKLNFGMRD